MSYTQRTFEQRYVIAHLKIAKIQPARDRRSARTFRIQTCTPESKPGIRACDVT